MVTTRKQAAVSAAKYTASFALDMTWGIAVGFGIGSIVFGQQLERGSEILAGGLAILAAKRSLPNLYLHLRREPSSVKNNLRTDEQ